ncbi:MAG: 50S ribosomal protein L25/general stress protein Ctc [Actinomycetes bacterium]
MPEVRIKAEQRQEFGKGAARRTRRAGNVPGVIYGHGTAPAHVALPGHELTLALKTANVLLRVDIADGTDLLTLPKSIQRDPVRQSVEHIDLVIVRSGEKVTIDVPVSVHGRVAGAIVELVSAAVSVEAEATHIPSEIVLEVDTLEVGAVVRAGDLVLPEGTTLVADADQIVLIAAAPTAEEEPEPVAEAGEAGEGAVAGDQPADSADEG